MDRDGFMRCLEGTKSMGQMHSNSIYNWNQCQLNQLVTERKAVKGTTEQGKRNCQQKLYHQKEII
jgi:hypothetical protein